MSLDILPVVRAAVWHVISNRVANLLEGEQLSHHSQLERSIVILEL